MSNSVQVQVGDGVASPKVTITITETSAGVFKFDLAQSGPVIGDLRGLFFDVGQEAGLTSATVSGVSAVTQTGGALGALAVSAVKGNDSITKVAGSDTTMNGALAYNGKGSEATGYDVGVEFGTSGIGKDDVGGVSFTLNLGKVTLADLAGQDFGVRMTSVGTLGGARDASVKLTGASFAVAPDADEAAAPSVEDTTAAGDVLRDAFANTDGGQVKQVLTWASLDGGQTKFAFGVVQPLGQTGATIVVNADGSYVIDAQGADALAQGVSVAFQLTYGLVQTYFDAAGHQVGQLAETSAMGFSVLGANDAPVVSGGLFGAATEDGAAVTVDALQNASDIDAGTVLTVKDIGALPSGVSYNAAAHSFTLNPADAAFQSLAAGQATVVTVTYGVSDGYVTVPTSVQWTVTGTNDAPVVSGAVVAQATEDGAKVTVDALANASDVDAGTVLVVTDVAALPAGVSYDAAAHSFTLNPADAGYQSLAAGQSAVVTVTYGVSDGYVTVPTSVQWTVTGTNDAPVVSGAVVAQASEDAAKVTVDALANASDVDAGTVLTVTDVAPLPDGVSYDAAAHTFALNPADASFQSLAAGETKMVSVAYGVSDGEVTVPAAVEWTVTGTNDAPVVSGAVAGQATEDGAKVSLDALANASDVDHGAVLHVVDLPAELPAGVTYDAVSGLFTLDPSAQAYQALSAGETTVVQVAYGISDGSVTVGATVQWTVTGVAEPVGTPPAAPVQPPVISPVTQPAITGDNFPVTPKDISHVTLYFETSPGDGHLDLRTVKIDDVPGTASHDFDSWIQASVDYVRAHDAGLPQGSELLGAALKYATTEIYYAIDGDTAAEPVPGGVLVQNHNLHATFDYGLIFG